MADNKDLVTHFNKLLEALRLVGGKGFMDMETFEVELRLGEKAHRFYPQFRMRRGEGAVLTPAFFPLVNRFVGWRPYSSITDFSFTEKLTFKKLLTQHQIATPEYSTDPNSGMTNVIVKKEGLSFSQGMKGPFRSAQECKIDGKEGEFYERFIPGQIVKVFYWNDRPVSIELRDMPNVVGDGRSTILELIEKKPFRREGKKRPLEIVTSTVAFHGKDLSTVLPENQTQIIDYRYSSEYDSPRIEEIDLLTAKHPLFDSPLRQVGEVLWKLLRQEGYSAYTYTVDAMLDTQGKLWFLEANSSRERPSRRLSLDVAVVGRPGSTDRRAAEGGRRSRHWRSKKTCSRISRNLKKVCAPWAARRSWISTPSMWMCRRNRRRIPFIRSSSAQTGWKVASLCAGAGVLFCEEVGVQKVAFETALPHAGIFGCARQPA